jgi:hypothetical protein
LDIAYIAKPARHQTDAIVTWIPPPDNFTKINVDAAVSKQSNRGVVAAICRDGSGQFLGASVLAVPSISDPATLEAIACPRVFIACC